MTAIAARIARAARVVAGLAVAVAPPAAAARVELSLPNGARLVSVASPGRLGIAARMSVGSHDDPPGLEGVAELTGSCLPLATHVHEADGELARAIAAVAASAHVTTTPTHTSLVMSGVSDARGALTLLTEILAIPSFPPHLVAAERARLATFVLDGGRGDGLRRDAARDALLVNAWPRADAWSVLAIGTNDCLRFHASAYRPDRLEIIVTGEGAPDAETLLDWARGPVGGWVLPGAAAHRASAVRQVVPRSPAPALVVGGEAAGVSIAFPVPAQGGSAAVRALQQAIDAAGLADALGVAGDASTPFGDLAAAPGSILLVDGRVADPPGAADALFRGLRRVARASEARAAPEVTPAGLGIEALDEGIALLEGGELVGEGFGAVDAPDVARAARALLRGPRAVVGQVPSSADSAPWLAAFPASAVIPAGMPPHPADRACAEEGRARLDALLAAHGASRLADLPRATRTFQTLRALAGEPAELLFETRVDADLATGAFRQESRPYQHRGGATVLACDEGGGSMRNPELGTIALTPFEVIAHRERIARDLPALLHAALTRVVAVRSEGAAGGGAADVARIVIADPQVGLTRLEIDPDTSLVRSVSYRVWIEQDDEPIEVRQDLSDYRAFEGVILPLSVGTVSPAMGPAVVLEQECAWSFAPSGPALMDLETDERDIRKVVVTRP